MICIKCKKEIPDGSAFCNHCGKEQNPKPKKRSRKRPQGTGTIRKDTRNGCKPYIALSPSSRYGTSRVYLGAFRTYKEAQEAIEKYNREGRPELYGATLADIYELWSESHFKTIAPDSAKMYGYMWKRFAPIHGMKIEEIRTIHFQDIVNQCTSYSAANIIRIMAQMICKYAMQNDVIQKNYADFLTIPKFEKREKRIFKADEIALLWDHVDDERVHPILFMTYTGLRIGELYSLDKTNVHLSDGYIICGKKTKAGKNRIVPLPNHVPELAQWLEAWDGKKSFLKMTAYNYREKQFYPVLEEIGILQKDDRSITPHSCRHTFASMCAASGIQPEQLQKIIGHANFSTTAEVYIHNDLDTLKAAMSKLKR